jgi:hypothetical protein
MRLSSDRCTTRSVVCMSRLTSRGFHKSWLIVTAIVVGSFGPVFSLATRQATSEPARLTLDILSWPVDQAESFAFPSMRFLTALTGGFLVGWGVMIFCMRKWVYDLAPEGVRKTVLVGLIAWFCFDSAGSIASGTPSNAIFNIIVLLIAVGPMWRPATHQ